MLSIILTLLVTLLVFGTLIFIHELGHYLVARKCGVGIIEFAIGMGPALKIWHGKYNDFSIRAFPIGGYVNMVGEYDDEIPPEQAGKTPLNSKPVWQRMLIVLAGPFMNLLFAFILMAIIVVSTGNMGSTVVAEFFDNSLSDKSGLQVGDEIVEINGHTIHSYTEMSYDIVSKGVEPLDIEVIRDGERIMLNGVQFGIDVESNINIGSQDFYVYAKDYTFGNIVYESFWQSYSIMYMTVDSLVDTFKGRYGIDAVGGPIAIGGQVNDLITTSDTFGEGVRRIAMLAVFISVSLGIVNLLPVPVLDGGRFVLYVIEAIRRKPLPKKIEQTVSAVFTALLFALIIFIAIKDIIGLF